jgi:hypothetical protein
MSTGWSLRTPGPTLTFSRGLKPAFNLQSIVSDSARLPNYIQALGTISSFDLFNSFQTSSTTKSTLKLRDAEFQWLCDQGKPVFVSGLDLLNFPL